MSFLPAPNPNVLNPIESKAILPTNINKSAQEILFPYFFFMGHSSNLALSRFTLSGQLFNGANL